MRRCSFGAFRTNMEFLAGATHQASKYIFNVCSLGEAMKNAFAFLLLLTIPAFAQTSRVIPQGTEIKVRTDSAIPAKPAAGSALLRYREPRRPGQFGCSRDPTR